MWKKRNVYTTLHGKINTYFYNYDVDKSCCLFLDYFELIYVPFLIRVSYGCCVVKFCLSYSCVLGLWGSFSYCSWGCLVYNSIYLPFGCNYSLLGCRICWLQGVSTDRRYVGLCHTMINALLPTNWHNVKHCHVG